MTIVSVYLNSLLATFNARENFRMQMSTNEHLSLPLSSLPGTHLNLQSHHEQSKVNNTFMMNVYILTSS